MPQWRIWIDKQPAVVTNVLTEYRILHRDDAGAVAPELVMYSKDDAALKYTYGPRVDLDVVKRLVAADATTEYTWLSWIWHQAYGGEAGLRTTQQRKPTVRQALMDNRRKELIQKWKAEGKSYTEKELSKFLEKESEAEMASLDSALKYGSHVMAVKIPGCYAVRHDWPGRDQIYERIVTEMRSYFAMYPKIIEMNNIIAGNTEAGNVGFNPEEKPVPTEPSQVASLDVLSSEVARVRRFHRAVTAGKDVRFGQSKTGKATVYSDDVCTLVVPLTYAAAVRYGSPNWPWADEVKFRDNVLAAKSPEWREILGTDGLVGYLSIDVPLPSNVSGEKRTRYNHVALVATGRHSGDGPTLDIVDESTTKWTYEDFIQKLRSLVDVRADEAPEGFPVRQSARPPEKTRIEQAIQHIEAAVEAFHDYYMSSSPSDVQRDVENIQV